MVHRRVGEVLLGATDDHDLGVGAISQRDAVEVGQDGGLDDRVGWLIRIFAAYVRSSCDRGGDDLVVGDVEAEVAQEGAERGAGPDGRVGQQPERDVHLTQAGEGVNGTGDRVAVDVEDAVNVDEGGVENARS